jgi:hypothetical protein
MTARRGTYRSLSGGQRARPSESSGSGASKFAALFRRIDIESPTDNPQ